MDLHVVILAAGKGTRMKSARPKVLHQVAGRALIDRVLDSAAALQPASTTLVLGHGADQVREHFGAQSDLQVVIQEPQLGTGHALLQTAPVLDWYRAQGAVQTIDAVGTVEQVSDRVRKILGK